jgi:LPXTG-motif cell wall-anchored protein
VYIDQPVFTLTSATELPAMNTLLFVLIGAAVVAVGGGAYLLTKKKA